MTSTGLRMPPPIIIPIHLENSLFFISLQKKNEEYMTEVYVCLILIITEL